MTNDDWRLLVESIVAFGALATFGTFVLVWLQLRTMERNLVDARHWNKMSTAFKIMPNHVLLNDIEDELNTGFINLMDRGNPLSEDECCRLLSKDEAKMRLLLKNYLNELESFCVAINVGVVHEEVAERQYGYKIKHYYGILKPYIMHLRVKYNDQRIYEELGKVAERWLKPKESTTSY
jgi:hypothetical protein